MKLSHDGKGLLIEVPAKSQYPQASMGGLKEDWSGFQNVVVELENLGRNTQSVILRVRSNEDNKERTDVEQKVAPGKAVMRVPVSGLKKTKLDAVTKVYLMMYQVPDGGCRVRVTRLYLEPKQDL